MQIWKFLHDLAANTQRCVNVAVIAQRCATNKQRCSDKDTTTSELRCFSKVVSTLDSNFNSQCTYKCYIDNAVASLKW